MSKGPNKRLVKATNTRIPQVVSHCGVRVFITPIRDGWAMNDGIYEAREASACL